MKIKELTLTDFKGINKLTIPLNGETTIIFGINGVGKSTILRAIDLIYANIIAKLTSKKKKLAELEVDDISFGRTRAEIDASFVFEDGYEASYGRSISREKKRLHSMTKLKNLVDAFEERYIVKPYDNGGDWIEPIDMKNMPVFVNYGVNRLVLDVPLRTNKEEFRKLDSFDKAIESKIDFRNLFKWFRNQEDYENEQKSRTRYDYEDRSLRAVKTAMLSMLDGFDDIYIDRKPLAMKVKKDGRYLKINQLSDGEKCTIALFGDLARRMVLANPGRENPLDGTGVVLIDELDLHMHVSWQRKVLNVLKETFPNIQFIITTHSPQILGECGEDMNLFVLTKTGKEIDLSRYTSFWGWDTNVILEEALHTPSVNDETASLLSKMYDCIDRKEYDEAEQIADLLDRKSSGRAYGVAGARVRISRGRRNEKNN